MRYEEKLSPTNQNKSLYIHRNPYPWQCHTVDQSIPFTIAIAIDPEPIQEIFGLVLMMLLVYSTGVHKICYTYLPHFAHYACLFLDFYSTFLLHCKPNISYTHDILMIFVVWWWCCGVEWKWVTVFRPFIVYGKTSLSIRWTSWETTWAVQNKGVVGHHFWNSTFEELWDSIYGWLLVFGTQN